MGLISERTLKQSIASDEALLRFKSNREREWGLFGTDTGIHQLNLAIGGLIPKRVTTVAARSGMGKTALTPQLFMGGTRGARKAAYLFCSWETDGSGIVDRYVCNRVGVTMMQLTQGAKVLGPHTAESVERTYEEAKALPVFYQTMSLSIREVQEYFREFGDLCERWGRAKGYGIMPVIVIDYIGLGKFENNVRAFDVGDFINGIKLVVNELNGAGVVFAQIKRSSDSKDKPTREDISEAQAIEQASDNLVVLHRPEYLDQRSMVDPETGLEIDSRHKALFRVLKSRDCGISDFVTGCDIRYNRFYDLNHTWDFDYWKLYDRKEFWYEHFGIPVDRL